MTVTEVLLNFRSALIAVAPAFDRVKIPWRRPDAYDNWDAVASELFRSLVVSTLQEVFERENSSMQVPGYDLVLESYADLNTIDTFHPLLASGRWVFHAFGTKAEPFDLVEVRRLSEEGHPLSEGLEICPVDGIQFALRLHGKPRWVGEK